MGKRRSTNTLAQRGSMPFKAPTPKRSPFDLPSLPDLDHKKARLLDQRDMQRFFYVEALLRSEVVWKLYQEATLRARRRRTATSGKRMRVELANFLFIENRQKLKGEVNASMRRLLWDESLRERFAVDDGWAVLLGAHHRYLRPRKEPFNLGEGIVDLTLLYRAKPHLDFKLKYLENNPSRFLFLMIDSDIVSSFDLRTLKEILHGYQQQQLSDTGPQKAPHIIDACAWLSYLRDYDLHVRDGLSLNRVGKHTHGAPIGRSGQAGKKRASARRKVTRAVRKVKDMIKSAQKGPWILSRL